MSNYELMWNKIKKLNLTQTQVWIKFLDPAKGIAVNFEDIMVLDVDLLEALKYWQADILNKTPGP